MITPGFTSSDPTRTITAEDVFSADFDHTTCRGKRVENGDLRVSHAPRPIAHAAYPGEIIERKARRMDGTRETTKRDNGVALIKHT